MMLRLAAAASALSLTLAAQVQTIPNTTFPAVRTLLNSNFSYLDTGKLRYTGTWSSATTYANQNLVIYSGAAYISLQGSNLNHQPDSSPTYWVVLPGGGGTGAVSSVFGRTGAVTAQSGDYASYYAPVTSGTAPLKGNNGGGFANVTASDIINLFSGCSGTMSPGADGACHSGSSPPANADYVYRIKTTIASTALTAAAINQNVTLFTLPAQAKILSITVKEGTRFACSGGCSGISSMTISVGRTGTETDYMGAQALMQAVSATQMYDMPLSDYSAQFTSHDLVAKFSVTNGTPGNLGSGSATNLTAGSVDVWVSYVVLP